MNEDPWKFLHPSEFTNPIHPSNHFAELMNLHEFEAERKPKKETDE